MEKSRALRALAGLSQENRLDVFRLLVERGPEGVPAGVIASALGIAPTTLSFHLKELTRAGLVDARPIGRFVYYAPNIATVNRLIGYLTENCCRGGSCELAGIPARRTRGGAAHAKRPRA